MGRRDGSRPEGTPQPLCSLDRASGDTCLCHCGLFREQIDSAVMKEPVLSLGL